MKKIIFSVALLMGFACVSAQDEVMSATDVANMCPKVAHWSLLLKGGGHYFRTTTKDIYEKNDYNGYLVGGEIEYDFNPLFGIGVDYTYNKFNRKFAYNKQIGRWSSHTNDVIGFGSANLTNIFGKYRRWQRWNWYANTGLGAYWRSYRVHGVDMSAFEVSKDKSSVVMAFGTTMEYRVNNWLSLNAGIQYKYYFKDHINGIDNGADYSTQNDRSFEADDSWNVTGGIRIKFPVKDKQHARNIPMAEYYPTLKSTKVVEEAPQVDLSPLNNRIKDLEDEVARLKNRPAPVEKISSDDTKVIVDAFKNIEFDFDKATLRPKSKTDLDHVADILKSNSSWKTLDLSGHTDGMGSVAYNQGLSERRVAAAKQYLVDKGIAGNKITTHAYGKSRPIATNATPEGRQKNRRVDVEINY